MAVCAAVLSLSVASFAQGRSSGGGASYQDASGDDSDLAEPTGDDPGDDPVEDIPADLMSDEPGGAPSRALDDPAPENDEPRVAVEAPPRRAAPRDEAAPESRDAAVDRVNLDCHAERGLFCDAVLADDLKTARCLLQYRDEVLDYCGRALDAAEPFLKKR